MIYFFYFSIKAPNKSEMTDIFLPRVVVNEFIKRNEFGFDIIERLIHTESKRDIVHFINNCNILGGDTGNHILRDFIHTDLELIIKTKQDIIYDYAMKYKKHENSFYKVLNGDWGLINTEMEGYDFQEYLTENYYDYYSDGEIDEEDDLDDY